MIKLKRMLQLLAVQTSQRDICSKLQMGRGVLSEYKKRAESTGISFIELSHKSDSELEQLLQTQAAESKQGDPRKKALDTLLPDLHVELQRRYVTVQLLWEEYIRDHPGGYQYTQFKKYLLLYRNNHQYVYHNTYAPADEMQIDFAGDSLYYSERKTHQKVPVAVLCCVLPYSGLCYAIALPNACMEHFYYGLSQSLEYFGGCPRIAKSDNMRQWVKHSDRYEPTFNDASLEWSLHYNMELEAARCFKPRDKGPVESFVNKLYQYIYARLRNEIHHDITALNNRMGELTDEYNDREMKLRGCSRRNIFITEEQPLLNPLPSEPFRFRYRKSVKVSSMYHVPVGKEQHYYSIPYQYVGKQAVVVWDYETVEVYVDNDRVCLHRRSFVKNGYTTLETHMPPGHQAYKRGKEYNASYYLYKASQIGPHTKHAVTMVLSSKIFIQQSYRSCQGILSLANRYGAQRMEAACERLNGAALINYGMIKNILEKKLDLAQEQEKRDIPCHDQLRGASCYQ